MCRTVRMIQNVLNRDRTLWAGIALLYTATRAALLWRFPPHVDESLYATWTAAGFEHSASRFVALSHGQQPLLEWIGMGFMQVGASPLLAVRLVSFFSGLGTLALVGVLGRRLGGRSTALVSGALFAILPFFLVYSVIGLYDPLATLFVAAAVVLLIRVAERPRLGTALLLGAVLGGGLLTKLTTELSFALLPFGALFVAWKHGSRARKLSAWAGSLVVSVAGAWVIYQVLRLSPYYEGLGAARRVFARHSIGTFLHHPGHWLAANGGSYGWALLGYLTVPMIVAIAVGFVCALKSHRAFAILLGVWAALPFVAAVALADIPYVRWLDTGLPALVIFGAYGAVAAFGAIPRLHLSARLRTVAIVGLAAALFLPALAWDARTLAAPLTRRYPGNDDVDYIRGSSAGGPWLRLVPDLRRLSAGRPLAVAWSGLEVIEYMGLALRSDPHISLVPADSPDAARALFGFGNGSPLAASGDGLGWRPIRTYPRPRHGVQVIVYVHGVKLPGRFVASAIGLRAALRTEGRLRRYVSGHPAVRAWFDAWRVAHPG